MRSMLEIIIAVTDCEPVTEEELKLCVCCLKAKLHFAQTERDKLVELIDSVDVIESSVAGRLKFRAECIKKEREISFVSNKMPMDEYLGAGNIPGTPEQKQRMAWAKKVFKNATGEEI